VTCTVAGKVTPWQHGTDTPALLPLPLLELDVELADFEELDAEAEAWPLPEADADELPELDAEAEAWPLPEADADELPELDAEAEAWPLPEPDADELPELDAEAEAWPLPEADADELPELDAEAEAWPLPEADADELPELEPELLDEPGMGQGRIKGRGTGSPAHQLGSPCGCWLEHAGGARPFDHGRAAPQTSPSEPGGCCSRSVQLSEV
jgi:hypothetical protein